MKKPPYICVIEIFHEWLKCLEHAVNEHAEWNYEIKASLSFYLHHFSFSLGFASMFLPKESDLHKSVQKERWITDEREI